MRRRFPFALPLAVALVSAACGKKRAEVRRVDEHEGEEAKTCMAIPSVVDRDVTIGEGCKLVVERPIVVRAKLVIGAGTTIAFEGGAGVRVEGGTFVTRGREDAPVLFTSHAQPQSAGDWAGVRFVASNGSALMWTTIEDAGGKWTSLPAVAPSASASSVSSAPSAAASAAASAKIAALTAFGPYTTAPPSDPTYDAAALVVEKDARDLVLDHLHVVHASNGGASVRGAESIARMTGCAFESNGGISVETIADAAPLLGGNTFGEEVRVVGTVTRSATWPLDVPFVVFGTLRVASPSSPTLTLQPGTTLRLESDASLQIGDGPESGALVATKTTFAAASKAKSSEWGGIDLQDAAASTKIDGCTIESSAANTPGPGIAGLFGAPPPVVRVPTGRKVTITSTTFRACAAPAFSGSTDCGGYESSSRHNKSIGQPLCAIDETLKAFGSLEGGAFGNDDAVGGLIGNVPEDAYGPGPGWGSGASGLGTGTIGGIGHSGNVGLGAGGGVISKTPSDAGPKDASP